MSEDKIVTGMSILQKLSKIKGFDLPGRTTEVSLVIRADSVPVIRIEYIAGESVFDRRKSLAKLFREYTLKYKKEGKIE